MKQGIIKQIDRKNNEPVLILTGSILKDACFLADDFVRVEISENQVVITKCEQTKLLQDMQKRNPSITKLIEEFNLNIEIK